MVMYFRHVSRDFGGSTFLSGAATTFSESVADIFNFFYILIMSCPRTRNHTQPIHFTVTFVIFVEKIAVVTPFLYGFELSPEN
jgi:hypothetical protein